MSFWRVLYVSPGECCLYPKEPYKNIDNGYWGDQEEERVIISDEDLKKLHIDKPSWDEEEARLITFEIKEQV